MNVPVRYAVSAVLVLAAAAMIAGSLFLTPSALFEPERRNVLTADGASRVVVMDFSEAMSLDPLPAGWYHRKFLTRTPLHMSFAEKAGREAIRLATDDSASMLMRQVDIDLARYPVLTWQWFIEDPITSPVDERTVAGDDHPARLFITFRTDADERRSMEIIWGNRLKAGEYKTIDGFPHYVANGGLENVGEWHAEAVDLLAIYREIWGREAAPPRIIDIGLFCDSDETDSSSVAYFAEVALERRGE